MFLTCSSFIPPSPSLLPSLASTSCRDFYRRHDNKHIKGDFDDWSTGGDCLYSAFGIYWDAGPVHFKGRRGLFPKPGDAHADGSAATARTQSHCVSIYIHSGQERD